MLAIHSALSLLVSSTVDQLCGKMTWEKNEGRLFEPMSSDNGLHHLISEPTHLMGDSKSCIDLIFTDQPTLIMKSSFDPSLHEQCHHQIVYGKLSVSNVALPPYTRNIWNNDKADFVAIRKCIKMFAWHEHLDNLICPSEQVNCSMKFS